MHRNHTTWENPNEQIDWMKKQLDDLDLRSERALLEKVNAELVIRNIAPTLAIQIANPDRIIQRVEEQKTAFASKLQNIRNWAVLIPILFTWLSLAVASASYAELAKQDITPTHELSSISFLQQWEDGFSVQITTPDLGVLHYSVTSVQLGLVSVPLGIVPHTFSIFALWDFVFIFGLIVITLVAQHNEARGMNEANQIHDALDQYLLNIVTERPFAVNRDNEFENRVVDFFNRLMLQIGRLEESISTFNTGLNTIPQEINDTLQESLTRSQEQTANALEKSDSQVQAALTVTNQHIRTLADSIKTIGEAATGLKLLWAELGTQANGMSEAALKIREAVTEINGAVAMQIPIQLTAMTTAQENVHKRLTELRDTYFESTHSLQETAEAMRTTGSFSQEASKIMQSSIDHVNEVLVATETRMQRLQTDTLQVSNAIQNTADAMNELSKKLGTGSLYPSTKSRLKRAYEELFKN